MGKRHRHGVPLCCGPVIPKPGVVVEGTLHGPVIPKPGVVAEGTVHGLRDL